MNQEFAQGWRMYPCVKEMQKATLGVGVRHHLYIYLSRYYRYLNMHPEEIYQRISEIDRRHPIQNQQDIKRIVQWGCNHPGLPDCDDPAFQKYCNSNNCFYAKLKYHEKYNKKLNNPKMLRRNENG